MVWCAQCAMDVEVEADEANGFSCCVQCGRVVEDTAFSSDVMFSKGADGDGELVGQMVGADGEARGIGRFAGGRMWGGGADSHEAAVSRGRYEISSLVEALRISPSAEATEAAHRLYRLALQRGFTKGRRVNQVAAVCLYIFCRLERRPYMLIDFSDQLSVNVYTLGAVFLQMLRLLRLDEHATFTKPIDPSLFLNRFVDRLRLPTQELKTKVGNTAMRLVQSMKRDWMLTGRRPSGICGAALFLAAHIHGVEKTKKDVISIVHIGWATVEKRVMELAETRDAELTLKELDERDRVMERHREQMLLDYERAAAERPGLPAAGEGEEGAAGAGEDSAAGALVPADPNAAGRYCEHVRAGTPLLAHGMCRHCLEEYLKVTLATQEGAYDPPAYLRNLRRDIRKRVREQIASERPVLMIKGSSDVLALEGPEGEEDDIHRRRHLENEAALLDGQGGSDGAGAAGPSTSDKPAAAAAAAAAAAEAASSGPGPSTADKAASGPGAGPGVRAKGRGDRLAEEEAFDEALHSSDLQPLAEALGGIKPAVATALMRTAAAAAGGRGAAAGPAGREGDGEREGEREGEGDGDGSSDGKGTGCEGGSNGEGEAAAAAEGAEDRAKRARREGDGAGGTGGELAPMEGSAGPLAAVAAATKAVAVKAGDDDDDDDGGGSGDNLSDVDDGDIAGYLATHEEASVREQLWTEMNKDWIEKQVLKQAEAEAAAKDPAKAAERAKRKGNRKRKAEVPGADDAVSAARNLLEAKKLSNKINYGALEDLFGNATPGATAGGGDLAAGRRSASQDLGASYGGAYGSDRAAATPTTWDSNNDGDSGGGGPSLASALAKRAAERARTAAADADKYSAALEEEQRRRGGLGGGFLDSLTFARNNTTAAPGGRSRPQGLSLKPRGR